MCMYGTMILCALLSAAGAIGDGNERATRLIPLSEGLSLTIRWINMQRSEFRATEMEGKLSRLLANPTWQPLVVTSARYRAVEGKNTSSSASQPVACDLSSWSSIDSAHAFELEKAAASYFAKPISSSQPTRCGLLGCWASHYSLLRSYAEAAANGTAPTYLLVLEDDVDLMSEFFTQELAAIREHAPAGWHAIRFSTHGKQVDEIDRVSCEGCAHLALYRSKLSKASYNVIPTEAYTGTHGVLYQASTAGETLKVLTAHGALSPDWALMEWHDADPEADGVPNFHTFVYPTPFLFPSASSVEHARPEGS